MCGFRFRELIKEHVVCLSLVDKEKNLMDVIVFYGTGPLDFYIRSTVHTLHLVHGLDVCSEL